MLMYVYLYVNDRHPSTDDVPMLIMLMLMLMKHKSHSDSNSTKSQSKGNRNGNRKIKKITIARHRSGFGVIKQTNEISGVARWLGTTAIRFVCSPQSFCSLHI